MPYLISVDDYPMPPVTPPALSAPAPAKAKPPQPSPIPGAVATTLDAPPVGARKIAGGPPVGADAPAGGTDGDLASALSAQFPGAQLQRVERPVVREVRDKRGRVLTTETATEVAYVIVLPAQVQHVPAAPVAQAPTEIDFKLKGNTLLTTVEITNALRGMRAADGQTLARAVAGLYRAKGYYTVEARAEGDTIQVVEGTSVVSGTYADYVAQAEVLGDDDMDGWKAKAMRRAARANGELLDLRINPRGMLRSGQAEVLANGQEDDSIRPVVAGSVTNLGPRYSGGNLAVAAVSGVAGGLEYKLSGVTNLSNDAQSEGGYYRGGGLTLMRPTPWGAFGVESSYATYRSGGLLNPLDMTGATLKISGVAQVYLANALTGEMRFNHVGTKSVMGTFHASDEVAYQSVSANLLYNGRAGALDIRADAQVEQGLSATRSTQLMPLQGTVDPAFTTLSGNVELARYWSDLANAGVSVKLGAQMGTDGTPASSQFVLGGPGRGSSYHSGVTSAPSGAYAGLEIAGPLVTVAGDSTVQPYVGLNMAMGKPTVGESVRVASAEAGLRAQLSSRLTAGVAYAKAIDGNPHTGIDDDRLNFYVSGSF